MCRSIMAPTPVFVTMLSFVTPAAALQLSINHNEQYSNMESALPKQDAVPIYRFFGHGNHFYNTDPATPSGYSSEGAKFYAYDTQKPDTVPIYEYYNSRSVDHYYTQNPSTPGGYGDKKVKFYAYATQQPGTVPIYGLWSGRDHMLSTDSAEGGYGNEGTFFYAFVPFECEDPDEPTGYCSAWGDPHYTATFFAGTTKFDHMGVGVYKLAGTKDGCFQVQAFQCPYRSSDSGLASYAGFAIKSGTQIVQIINDKVYVDDAEVDPNDKDYILLGPMAGTPRGGLCLSSTGCGNTTVGYFHTQWKSVPVTPGFEHEMKIKIPTDMVKFEGVCGLTNTEDSAMSCDGSLFSATQLDVLKNMCDMPTCDTPPGYVPVVGPVDACKNANIDLSEADLKCNGVADKDACMVDYCGCGGCEEAVINSPTTPSPPATLVVTPLPTTPPTAPTPPPTASPTEGGNDVPKCTNCGSRPLECWETCGGTKGYCTACDSLSGRRGACCYQGDPGEPLAAPANQDPDECSTVDKDQFLYHGYHMCVLTNS